MRLHHRRRIAAIAGGDGDGGDVVGGVERARELRAPGPGSPSTRIHLTLDLAPRFILDMGQMTDGLKIGALATRWDAAALILPAAVLAAVALLPQRWTGLAAPHH